LNRRAESAQASPNANRRRMGGGICDGRLHDARYGKTGAS
jgi:hypothetical protein